MIGKILRREFRERSQANNMTIEEIKKFRELAARAYEQSLAGGDNLGIFNVRSELTYWDEQLTAATKDSGSNTGSSDV